MWFCRLFAEISDECRGKAVASSPRAVNQQTPQPAKFHICLARITFPGMQSGDAAILQTTPNFLRLPGHKR